VAGFSGVSVIGELLEPVAKNCGEPLTFHFGTSFQKQNSCRMVIFSK
jgi:hypothetical protein